MTGLAFLRETEEPAASADPIGWSAFVKPTSREASRKSINYSQFDFGARLKEPTVKMEWKFYQRATAP